MLLLHVLPIFPCCVASDVEGEKEVMTVLLKLLLLCTPDLSLLRSVQMQKNRQAMMIMSAMTIMSAKMVMSAMTIMSAMMTTMSEMTIMSSMS